MVQTKVEDLPGALRTERLPNGNRILIRDLVVRVNDGTRILVPEGSKLTLALFRAFRAASSTGPAWTLPALLMTISIVALKRAFPGHALTRSGERSLVLENTTLTVPSGASVGSDYGSLGGGLTARHVSLETPVAGASMHRTKAKSCLQISHKTITKENIRHSPKVSTKPEALDSRFGSSGSPGTVQQ